MENIGIDINCDLGEGIGNEKDIMPLISSCSIACGGHAGNDQTIREVALLAKENNVKIGAHPSYPDRENFGRQTMHMPHDALIDSIKHQMSNFVSIISSENISLHHIKAHGALYNDIANSPELARAFLQAVEPYKDGVFLYVPFNSAIEGEALVAGFEIRYEAFGDRNYNMDGSLVSRNEVDAIISEPRLVLEHIGRMVREREVKLPDTKRIRMLADTYCIHGDTPNALEILTYLSDCLAMYNIQIRK